VPHRASQDLLQLARHPDLLLLLASRALLPVKAVASHHLQASAAAELYSYLFTALPMAFCAQNGKTMWSRCTQSFFDGKSAFDISPHLASEPISSHVMASALQVSVIDCVLFTPTVAERQVRQECMDWCSSDCGSSN